MKIMSGFLILVIMLAVAGIFSIYELMSISSSVQRLLDDNYKSVVAARKMIEALERQDNGLLLWISGKETEGQSMIDDADNTFLSALDVARNNCTIPNEQNVVEDINNKYSAFQSLWKSTFSGAEGSYGMDWYLEHVHPAFQAVKTTADQLMAMNDATMYRTASDVENRMHRITMPGIVAIVAALVFAFVFNYFINHYFVNPIISITKEVQSVLMTGKPANIEIETNDELRDLASAIQDLSYSVRK